MNDDRHRIVNGLPLQTLSKVVVVLLTNKIKIHLHSLINEINTGFSLFSHGPAQTNKILYARKMASVIRGKERRG